MGLDTLFNNDHPARGGHRRSGLRSSSNLTLGRQFAQFLIHLAAAKPFDAKGRSSMQINKALTNLIRSQSLRSVAEERNRGAILFDDGATMQVNAVGHCIQKRVRTRMQALGVNQL